MQLHDPEPGGVLGRRIYLDAAASAPLDPMVLERMLPVLRHVHANSASAHWAGAESLRLVDEAREQVGALASRSAGSVIFTGGATEANNLALRGLLTSTALQNLDRRAVVSVATEHPSVLRTLASLAGRGVRVRLVGVLDDGQVDLDELRDAVDSHTLLVSVMGANNETGVVPDLGAVAEIAHSAGAFLHSDASQLLAWGRLGDPGSPAAGVDPLDVDLVTVSAHKMHGPQGVGALVASGAVRKLIEGVTTGGGQENGLRGGTQNVAGIVGIGAAAKQAIACGPPASAATRMLRDSMHLDLVERLAPSSGGAATYPKLNGHPTRRLPGVLNLAFGDTGHAMDSEDLLLRMPSLAASTGSACHSGMPEPSSVLMAMGHSIDRARSSIRLSLSRFSTASEVAEASALIARTVRVCKEMEQ